MKPDSTYQRIYRAVAKIPKGKVATYGQIAQLAGIPKGARQVGYALSALRDDWKNVPWHRVINAQGTISLRAEPGFEGFQEHLLKKEGVRFDAAGRVSLERFRWNPGDEAEPPPKALKRRANTPKKKPKAKRVSRSGTRARARSARASHRGARG